MSFRNAALIYFGAIYPREFRFLPNGRAGSGRRDINGQNNQNIRQAIAWIERLGVLVDYHNKEFKVVLGLDCPLCVSNYR